MEFDGIPWNFKCANFNDLSSSMEFHGTRSAPISLTQAVPWNSMELLIFPQKVPWNSVELFLKFHGIPWNLINFILKKIIFLNIVFGV